MPSSEPERGPPIRAEDLRIEPFRETADVREFDCDCRELKDFLTTTEVADYEKKNLGKTYLVYWQPEGALVAYFTISSDSLRFDYFKSVKSFSIPGEIRTSTIPGILIGRLAVDSRFKRRDVGTHLLRYIAGLALSAPAAVRILFLEAYPSALDFYQRRDFVIIEHQKLKKRRNRLMYFDLTTHPDWGGNR